jgi:integrase
MSKGAATCLLPKEYDPKVKGLYLQRGARGDTWYLYYRTREGQQRRPKIGDAKVINRTVAREMAAKILLEVAQGSDPQAVKPEAGKTLIELRQEYDRLHATVEIKQSTKESYDILWDKHIVPFFGANTPIRSITKADVIRFKSSMRDAPVVFNRASKVLSHAFLMAEDWGWRDEQTNPCYRLKRYREQKRTRLPSEDEAKRLMATLRDWEDRNPWFVGMIMLLILTGARRGEIMKSRRDWWQGNKLVLPDSKTGGKIIPISTHAQEIMRKIPKVDNNPYLIAGKKPGTHFSSPRKTWLRLCADAGIEGLNMHDLRRLFASISISSGQSLEQTMQLMGHTEAQTTKGYAFLMTQEKIAAMQATGDKVMEFIKKAPN